MKEEVITNIFKKQFQKHPWGLFSSEIFQIIPNTIKKEYNIYKNKPTTLKTGVIETLTLNTVATATIAKNYNEVEVIDKIYSQIKGIGEEINENTIIFGTNQKIIYTRGILIGILLNSQFTKSLIKMAKQQKNQGIKEFFTEQFLYNNGTQKEIKTELKSTRILESKLKNIRVSKFGLRVISSALRNLEKYKNTHRSQPPLNT